RFSTPETTTGKPMRSKTLLSSMIGAALILAFNKRNLLMRKSEVCEQQKQHRFQEEFHDEVSLWKVQPNPALLS
ncbi:MAG: hypothetical protein VXW29_16905, partial [SAR324 cluster bacterium]|nr:hypothetical protein [SAR324 cluster bacterium]